MRGAEATQAWLERRKVTVTRASGSQPVYRQVRQASLSSASALPRFCCTGVEHRVFDFVLQDPPGCVASMKSADVCIAASSRGCVRSASFASPAPRAGGHSPAQQLGLGGLHYRQSHTFGKRRCSQKAEQGEAVGTLVLLMLLLLLPLLLLTLILLPPRNHFTY